MLRRPTAVLGPLVPKVTPVGRRVSGVARPGVVNHGFADLGEVGSEPVDEHQDEEHPHEARDTSGGEPPWQTGTSVVTHDLTAPGARASTLPPAGTLDTSLLPQQCPSIQHMSPQHIPLP